MGAKRLKFLVRLKKFVIFCPFSEIFQFRDEKTIVLNTSGKRDDFFRKIQNLHYFLMCEPHFTSHNFYRYTPLNV